MNRNEQRFLGLASIDFNGDGKSDFAAYSLASSSWNFFFSAGNLFNPLSVAPVGALTNVVYGNFDKSGKRGIIGYYPPQSQWYLAVYPDFQFVPFTTSGPLINVNAGDYEGLGWDQVAGFDPNTGDWWVTAGPNLTFVYFGNSAALENVRVGDFNGDGKMDLVGFEPNSSTWQFGISDGTSFTFQPFARAGKFTNVVVADFVGKGVTGIAGYFAGVWYMALAPDFTFLPFAQTGYLESAVGADLGGTGKAMIVAYDPQGSIFYASAGSSFFPVSSPVGELDQVFPADVNGDGKADIVGYFGGSNSFYVALGPTLDFAVAATTSDFETVPGSLAILRSLLVGTYGVDSSGFQYVYANVTFNYDGSGALNGYGDGGTYLEWSCPFRWDSIGTKLTISSVDTRGLSQGWGLIAGRCPQPGDYTVSFDGQARVSNFTLTFKSEFGNSVNLSLKR